MDEYNIETITTNEEYIEIITRDWVIVNQLSKNEKTTNTRWKKGQSW